MLRRNGDVCERVSRFACLTPISLAILTIAFASGMCVAQSAVRRVVPQPVTTQSYAPSAYGTYAFVGNTVLVGQTAPVSLTGLCGITQQPLSRSASAAGVNVPLLVNGGAVNTQISSANQQA